MGHANGIITAPVNTDDVSAVLGVASHDVATLCLAVKRDDKFNKNKPYRGTQPEVKSRTVDNATNETGKFLGRRGETTGFPVYWGMRYPMNTAQQNASGQPRNNLLELCYDCCLPTSTNHPNYEYMKPVLGTDFCRLDDFVGFQHGVGAFLDAGVAGAVPGKQLYATLDVNKYANEKIPIYALIPSDSVGWTFKDIIPEADSYYLVAEFYKKEMYVSKSSASPSKVVKSSVSLGAAPGMGISFDVPISEILSACGLSTTVNVQFIVCVGFNKYSGNAVQGSSAFIAPWVSSQRKCTTLVTVYQGSPYVVSFTKYALPNPTSDSSYVDFSSSERVITSETLFFKGSIYNNSGTPLDIYFQSSALAKKMRFRAKAVGNFGEYAAQNGYHLSSGGDNYNGAYCNLKVGTNANMANPENNITINNAETKILYFEADKLIPYGHTTNIIIEVSNDDGASWAVTGMCNCNFKRNW